MTTYAKLRTEAVLFNPTNVTINNALFVSSSGNTLTMKDDTGVPGTVSTDTSASYNIKQMQAAAAVRLGKTVSKKADGRIIEAESDASGAQQPVGIALSAFALAGDLGNVLLFGQNAASVLTGLGFTPSDEIYIGETTGGYVNDITPFVGNDDSLVKVAVADCAAGTASAVATDLIMITQVIARP